MKIIVIGASGFVGRNVFALAKRGGHEVVGTRYSSSSEGMVKFDLLEDRIADILPARFRGEEPACAVICASDCKIDRCYLNQNATYRLNVTKTKELLTDLNSGGIRFVFLSTDVVYDGARGYYDETVPPCPSTEYGKQKVEVEGFILGSMPAQLVYRLSKVVSDEPSESQPFTELYQKSRKGEPIRCIQGQVFSPTCVQDIARAILMGFELGLKGLYHVVNPEFFSREELARQFRWILGSEIEIDVKPVGDFGFPEGRPLKTYLDGHRFRRATGMQFTSMKEVLMRFATKISAGGTS